jgi:hypothetical protein
MMSQQRAGGEIDRRIGGGTSDVRIRREMDHDVVALHCVEQALDDYASHGVSREQAAQHIFDLTHTHS